MSARNAFRKLSTSLCVAAFAGKEEEGTLRILALEVTGLAVSVKVEEIYPKERYVNYLSLLRISGEWRIVNKIFDVKSLEVSRTVPAKP